MELTTCHVRRFFVIFAIGAVLVALAYFGPSLLIKKDHASEQPTATIKMGGTSVAAFMIDKWEGIYRREKLVKFKYACPAT